MDELLPIGRFARRTGLSIRALRRYDALGLLRPSVVAWRTGYRYYRPDQAARAERIRELRALAMPLGEMGVEEYLSDNWR